jgi:hypothetical protein
MNKMVASRGKQKRSKKEKLASPKTPNVVLPISY